MLVAWALVVAFQSAASAQPPHGGVSKVGTAPVELPRTVAQHSIFTLVEGRGLPVCEAYLQQVNQASYSNFPECDIPQEAIAPGMVDLHRTWVSRDEIEKIDGDIASYLSQGTPEAAQGKTQLPPNYETRSYRFEPPVDIENNGTPDQVLMWNHDNRASPECGSADTRGSPYPILFGATGIILTSDGLHIDTNKTKAVFGNARGGVEIANSRGGHFIPRFAPVGYSYNIFKFRSMVYYSAFVSDDFDYGSDWKKFARKPGAFAVFLNRGGKTQLICKFTHSNDWDS